MITTITANISATTEQLLSNLTGLDSIRLRDISICNKFAGTITVSVYRTNSTGDFYIVYQVSIRANKTLFLTGFTLDRGTALNITVAGGDADVELNYE